MNKNKMIKKTVFKGIKNKDELWERELAIRRKLLEDSKEDLIKRDWFNSIIKTHEYTKNKKQEDYISKLFQSLFNFHNNSMPPQLQGKLIILKFIMEVCFDLKASTILADSGAYKQANNHLRAMLENAFRLILFKQYHLLLSNLDDNNFYSLKKEYIDLINFSDSSIKTKLSDKQKNLSSYVHTAKKTLSTKVFVFAFSETKYKEWKKEVDEVVNLIIDMLNKSL